MKLPRKGSFKSSLRKTPKKKSSSKRKPKEKEPRTFIIKPIPINQITPVLVFINPKSGGNQVSYGENLFTLFFNYPIRVKGMNESNVEEVYFLFPFHL